MKRPEETLHRSVVQLLDHLGWWYWHTPNGELRDKRVAGKLKAMGVRPGVVDFIIAEEWERPAAVYRQKRGHYLPLFGEMIALELKIRPNKIKPGSKQKEFMEAAEARGWLTGVCYSMEEVTGFLQVVRPLNGRTIERCGLNKTPPKP